MAEMIRLGAHRKGSDPAVDEAIHYYPEMEAFLSQDKRERTGLTERDEIADAFQELKRFEIAEADHKQRAALRLRRIETITFDEIAITRFHRRASEDRAE